MPMNAYEMGSPLRILTDAGEGLCAFPRQPVLLERSWPQQIKSTVMRAEFSYP